MNTQNETPKLDGLLAALADRQRAAADFAKQEKEARADIAALETKIRDIILQLGLDSATGAGLRVAPIEAVYPKVENWDDFYKFIKETDYFHLLERRLTSTGYRELLSMGRQVPGVVPVVSLKLRVTKA